MSLLIKGMDMPSSCQLCKLKRFVGSRVLIGCKPEVLYECPFCDDLFALNNKRQPSCKFEQLPKPHGRLIDADEFFNKAKEYLSNSQNDFYRVSLLQIFKDILNSTETVIEKENAQ